MSYFPLKRSTFMQSLMKITYVFYHILYKISIL